MVCPRCMRRADCWDDAVAECSFLHLKTERVWERSYASAQEARRDIADYIVGFYNARRIHSALGYLSPNAYERKTPVRPRIRASENT